MSVKHCQVFFVTIFVIGGVTMGKRKEDKTIEVSPSLYRRIELYKALIQQGFGHEDIKFIIESQGLVRESAKVKF